MFSRLLNGIWAVTIASLCVLAIGPISGSFAATPIDQDHSSADHAGISYEFFPEARRWPGNVIRYHVGYQALGGLVREAAKKWNRSGAKVIWKEVPAKKAQVTIRRVVMKKYNGWAGQLYRPGTRVKYKPGQLRGSIIKIHPRVLKMSKERPVAGFPTVARLQAPQIMVHEMGHIMGLAHTEECAVMNPGLKVACPRHSEPGNYRCRILETDDIRGSVRLFGGTPLKQTDPLWCKVEGAPDPVTKLSVNSLRSDPVFGGKSSLIVKFKMPMRNLPAQTGFRVDAGVQCKKTTQGARWTTVHRRVPGLINESHVVSSLPPGQYCASLYSASTLGVVASYRATSRFTVPD